MPIFLNLFLFLNLCLTLDLFKYFIKFINLTLFINTSIFKSMLIFKFMLNIKPRLDFTLLALYFLIGNLIYILKSIIHIKCLLINVFQIVIIQIRCLF